MTDNTIREALDAIKADAHSVFNDPPAETPQVVRDVIEWYDAELRTRLAAPTQPVEERAETLACGHPASLLLRSAETGAPLYCELCDDKTGRRDAEAMEEYLQALLDAWRSVALESGDWLPDAHGLPKPSASKQAQLAAPTQAPAAAPVVQVPAILLTALRFYARAQHFHVDRDRFDTVSGEPQNWLCHDEDETMIEDGTVARLALQGVAAQWDDGGEDETPQPIDGEVFAASPQEAPAPAPQEAATPAEPVAWVRDQRGEYEGRETLDPLFALGASRPVYHHGATYSPLYTAHVPAQQPVEAPAPAPEPVAYRYRYSPKARWNYADESANGDPAVEEQPLYAAPAAPLPPEGVASDGVLAERERCAKLCEAMAYPGRNLSDYQQGQTDMADKCAAAIRAANGGKGAEHG